MLLSVERPNRGSLCLSMTRGHAAALYGLVQAVLPASDWNMCKRTIVVPQELGRTLFAPRRIPGWRYRVTNSRPWRRTRPPRSESNECNRGTAKRRKRSAAGWAARSRSTLIVLMKPGNRSRGTRWREGKTERGCLMLDPESGNTSEASYLDQRVTVTIQDSNPGMRPSVAWRNHHQMNRMR